MVTPSTSAPQLAPATPALDLAALLRVDPLPKLLDEAARLCIDGKTKPLGALGQLEDVAGQVIRVQGSLQPVLNRPWMIVFAADHGIAAEGVSAFPQDVTWQMVMNFLGGGAAINVFCETHGLGVTIVDAGVKHDFTGVPGTQSLRHEKIAPGTANSAVQPAMTQAQRDAALLAGARLVDELFAQGCNIVGFGEMGIANTASASLLMHKIGGVPLIECVGRGTGLNDEGLQRKLAVLQRAAARTAERLEPLEALAEYGGFEIAMITGACLRAAQLRMIVLVDGFIASSAVLVAARSAPAVLERCVFAHAGAEQGHQRLLALMQARALLQLGLRLGEGSGAALAYPLLKAAVAFVNDMASFASAGVSDDSDLAGKADA